MQIAYAAAHLAWEDAGLSDAKPDPDRMGVVYGSEMIPGDHAEVVEAVLGCARTGQLIQVFGAKTTAKSSRFGCCEICPICPHVTWRLQSMRVDQIHDRDGRGQWAFGSK